MTEDLTNRLGSAAIIEAARESLARDCARGGYRFELKAARARKGRLHREIASPNEAGKGVPEASKVPLANCAPGAAIPSGTAGGPSGVAARAVAARAWCD